MIGTYPLDLNPQPSSPRAQLKILEGLILIFSPIYLSLWTVSPEFGGFTRRFRGGAKRDTQKQS